MLSGLLNSDVVSVDASSASYDTKDVGTAKTVSASGLSLTGADAGNYLLINSGVSGPVGVITDSLTVSGVTAKKQGV